MVPAMRSRDEWALTWERSEELERQVPVPPPGLDVKAIVAPEQVHENAETKGEEAIRAAELPKLPELGAKEAGPLAAGWLAEIRPIMMDLSASAAVWWEHIMHHAEKAYQRWLEAGGEVECGTGRAGMAGKVPFLQGEVDDVSSGYGLQGLEDVSAWGASGEAELAQLPGGAEGGRCWQRLGRVA